MENIRPVPGLKARPVSRIWFRMKMIRKSESSTGKAPKTRRAATLTTLALITAVVAACNTTDLMDLPKTQDVEPIEVSAPLSEQVTFALTKVVANIKRGTTIAHFPAGGLDVEGSLCNYRHTGKSTVEWGAGTSVLGNWSTELGEIFYEVLSGKGLNIAGDPKDLFSRKETVASAEYLIGARIKEIRGNLCQVHHWWDGRPLNEFSGEMFIDVEWTVFSSLLQRVILKTNTEGYFKQKKPKKDGIILIFHEAFARAAENLTSKTKFIDIALRQDSLEEEAESDLKLKIFFTAPKERKVPIQKDFSRLLASVVTIRLGLGHGSGFIISSDGLILTNSHVVGNASRVSVVLNNGLEIEGEVRRRNKKWDVALIKVPLHVPSALSVRMTAVKLLEKVYVIGSPIKEELHSTVTTGIVSAVRRDKRSGLEFIQADAAISPGNSGGPLLDENGNVIGISVAKIITEGSESLNMFIPIKLALDALNIHQNSKGETF